MTQDKNLKAMLRTIERGYEQCARDLERLTKIWERELNGLNINSLPSYQRALTAIRIFKEEAVRRYETQYRQQEEQMTSLLFKDKPVL